MRCGIKRAMRIGNGEGPIRRREPTIFMRQKRVAEKNALPGNE
jgi:hypothetical protein